MKRNLLLSFFILTLTNNLFAQNPLVKQWDYGYGGNNVDVLSWFQQTTDGGYILGGHTSSGISGDVTQSSLGFEDYWMVKINSIGIKQWDKRFGGDTTDILSVIRQTSDGGYILGGYTWSDSSGDVSQHILGPFDFWIVKTDSLGIKQWDKRYGGESTEYLYGLQQTSDNGFILGGSTYSNVSGDVTENSRGGHDYWAIKIDSLGNKQWDKRFGGLNYEFMKSLEQTMDGGYIFGGWTTSDSSGDMSQHVWGSHDYWIIKTDSLGNKQWDKRYGGIDVDDLNSVLQTTDGGYILGGFSRSDSTGNVSNHTHGVSDYWIVKIDSTGNIQWDKRYGGSSDEDEVGDIKKTNDGGYLVSGTSYSNSGFDKSENNLGQEQTWIIKIDNGGIKMWDKTLLTDIGSTDDELGFAIQSFDGCYVMGNYTIGGIGGNKSQPSLGFSDFWIIKFCDTTLISGINAFSTSSFEFSVNPNPFSSEISISIQKQNIKQATFTIKNILGENVFYKQENNLSYNYSKTIDLSDLSKGVYFLDFIIDGEHTVKKVVKQ